MKTIQILSVLIVFLVFHSCNSAVNKGQEIPTNSGHAPTYNSLAPKVVDEFEKKFGIHEGKRRNHIDGFCFSGNFRLNDTDIKNFSKSKIFSEKPLKIYGRFSHKGGSKKNEGDPGEYGMAFEVHLEDGSIQNFSMNTLDFFPVKTPEGFLQLMQAKVSGKPEDFEKMKKDHPEFVRFKAHYKNKPKELKAYANHHFNSVNSFYFVNDSEDKTPVRWSFVPQNSYIKLDPTQKIDLFNETQKALEEDNSLKWEMVVTIANKNEDYEDASVPWKGEHKKVVAATLTIDQIMKTDICTDRNFDPLQLQAGVQPTNDPVLKFRSPAYAESFGRRIGEKMKMSH